MSLDFGTLQVERVIIHQIPKRKSGQEGSLRVTDVESPLDLEDKNFFKERIQESLEKSEYAVAFQEGLNSPIRNLIAQLFEFITDDFVRISQRIASHLYNSQTGVNPPGVLVIAQIKLDNKPSLAILKIEKEKGMQYEEKENDNGLLVCNVKQLPNLMLTGGKVFKVAIFVKESDEITGYISDKQRSQKNNLPVAEFFLQDFLGCYLLDSPKLITQQFVRIFQDFINNDVIAPESKIKYEGALISLIQNNQNTIESVDFVNTYLDLDDRQILIDKLEEKNIPTTSFDKDISSIGSSMKNMHMSFNNNDIFISISGNVSSLEGIKFEETDNGRVRVSFEAELDKVGK